MLHFVTHKFVIVVDRKFFDKKQNNVLFYLRIMALDIVDALVDENEIAEKYTENLLNKCLDNIHDEVRIFKEKKIIIFYLEVSGSYLEDFFEEPLDNPE